MANRNFDASSIIQRLQSKNAAQGLYRAQQAGQRLIRNPQTSDPSPQRIASFKEGSETFYSRTLQNTTTVNTGATCN